MEDRDLFKLSYTIHTMAADDLVMLEARASASMALI